MARSAKNPIKSLDRTVEIINALKSPEWRGVTELSNELNLNKGSVHHHLSTLEDHGFVVKKDGQYRLGMRFLEFGVHARDRMKLYNIGKREIDKLADETGEIANLMIEENGLGVYLYISDGAQALTLDTKVGTRQHLHTCALGKAILASLPEQRVDEIIDNHGLPAKTSNTVTDPNELKRGLEQMREQGIAFDGEERAEGICCVAAPIQSTEGDLLGAVSVSGPFSRVKGDRLEEEIPELVQEVATVIGINATYE